MTRYVQLFKMTFESNLCAMPQEPAVGRTLPSVSYQAQKAFPGVQLFAVIAEHAESAIPAFKSAQ